MAEAEAVGQEEEFQELNATPVINAGALNALVRAEIDCAVTTAKAYPRSLSRFAKEVLDMATLNPDVARAAMYTLKRDGKAIIGPSARLAEIVLSAWGNSRGGARIVDDSGDFVTAQGFVHDLERNVSISFEVRRRITTRDGKRYGADMIGVTANAAASIAFRNAVFKVVPKAYWGPAFDKALGVVRGDVKTLAARRASAIETVGKLGVNVDRVLATLGVEGMEDIGLDELVMLHGILNAIEEGDTTVDQAFVSKRAEQPAGAAAPGMAGLRAAVTVEEPKPGASPPAEAAAVPSPENGYAAEAPYPTLAMMRLPTSLSDLDLATQARAKAAEIAAEEGLGFDDALKRIEALVTAAKNEHAAARKVMGK